MPTVTSRDGTPIAYDQADAAPQGRSGVLEGQTHEVAAEALAPVLIEFFTAR